MSKRSQSHFKSPASATQPSDQYEVGFKKPPKQTRFAKGQSGNPNGRPKGSKNLATIVVGQAMQFITVSEHGKTRQVTKLEAAMTQLLNKAASGDFAAVRLLLQIMPGMEAQLAKSGAPVLSDERDRQVLAELLKRFAPSGQAKKVKQSK